MALRLLGQTLEWPAAVPHHLEVVRASFYEILSIFSGRNRLIPVVAKADLMFGLVKATSQDLWFSLPSQAFSFGKEAKNTLCDPREATGLMNVLGDFGRVGTGKG